MRAKSLGKEELGELAGVEAGRVYLCRVAHRRGFYLALTMTLASVMRAKSLGNENLGELAGVETGRVHLCRVAGLG